MAGVQGGGSQPMLTYVPGSGNTTTLPASRLRTASLRNGQFSEKCCPHPKTSCTGVFSWAHTPDRKLMRRISAVKTKLPKCLWALAVCVFIHSILHPDLCCRVNGHLRPHLTCSMCHQQTAQLERESRKGSVTVTFLHWKTTAGFVKLLKKTHTSYRCFQKLSNTNPEVNFLAVLAAMEKWPA